MSIPQYAPPVEQLLSYGSPRDNLKDWSPYLKLGISLEDVPELMRMVSDENLYQADAFMVEWGAPIHAWRILGQLQAEAALPSLIGVLQSWGDDEDWWEWINEELPIVFRLIGAAAIPALAAYLANKSQPVFPRGTAIGSIEQIGNHYPEHRSQCVTVLTNQLKAQGENEPELNGYLVVALVDLKAVESASVIEQAFQADSVDEAFIGDWDEVQVRLGLKSREQVPEKYPLKQLAEVANASKADFSGFSSGYARAKAKERAKNAAICPVARIDRRKNRRTPH